MFHGEYHKSSNSQLDSTKFFKLVSLALIVYMTPAPAFFTRGIIGFIVLIFLAIILGSLEKCFHIIKENIRFGISRNKPFFFLAVWYAAGVISNILLRGGGFSDWRLLVSPILLLAGLMFTLGLYHDDRCYRSLQIALLLVSGVQAVYTYQQIASNPSIAREMFIESQGAWSYGNQSSFAVFAILLPLFIWRALSERGVLRGALMAANILIFLSIAVSTLATPLSLFFIGIMIIALLALIFPVSRQSHFKTLVISALLVAAILSAYTFGREIPVLSPIYYRVANFLEDPTSGGYSGLDLEESRWKKVEFSIASFIQNPLLGMGGGSIRSSSIVGGHSSLFDSLGVYGLLGGGGALCALMAVMLAKSFMRFRRERNWESLVGLATVALLVIAGIVNPYLEGFQPVSVFLMARPFLDRRA